MSKDQTEQVENQLGPACRSIAVNVCGQFGHQIMPPPPESSIKSEYCIKCGLTIQEIRKLD